MCLLAQLSLLNCNNSQQCKENILKTVLMILRTRMCLQDIDLCYCHRSNTFQEGTEFPQSFLKMDIEFWVHITNMMPIMWCLKMFQLGKALDLQNQQDTRTLSGIGMNLEHRLFDLAGNNSLLYKALLRSSVLCYYNMTLRGILCIEKNS